MKHIRTIAAAATIALLTACTGAMPYGGYEEPKAEETVHRFLDQYSEHCNGQESNDITVVYLDQKSISTIAKYTGSQVGFLTDGIRVSEGTIYINEALSYGYQADVKKALVCADVILKRLHDGDLDTDALWAKS